MTHRKKFMLTAWHIFAIATLVASSALVGLILYWTVQGNTNPVVEFPEGITFSQTEVKAGDELILHAGYCKNLKTTSTIVTRSFQDDITFYVPAGTNNVPTGCNLDFKTVVKIPSNLPPDTYTYNMTFTYQVNPIVNKQYIFESNKFKVVK